MGVAMIARTVVRVLVSLLVVILCVTRLAPLAAHRRGFGLDLGVLLIVVGGAAMALRLVARRWLDAQAARAQPLFGYAAPAWVHDATGPLVMLAGLCLVAWWS